MSFCMPYIIIEFPPPHMKMKYGNRSSTKTKVPTKLKVTLSHVNMVPFAWKAWPVPQSIPAKRSRFLRPAELPKLCMIMNSMKTNTELNFATRIFAIKRSVGLLMVKNSSFADCAAKLDMERNLA